VSGEPFVGCTSTPVTVMKTDCTPESDVGASARLTFSVEIGLLLSPPPQAGSSAPDRRADARTDRKTARLIAIELFTPLAPLVDTIFRCQRYSDAELLNRG